MPPHELLVRVHGALVEAYSFGSREVLHRSERALRGQVLRPAIGRERVPVGWRTKSAHQGAHLASGSLRLLAVSASKVSPQNCRDTGELARFATDS